MARLLYRLDVQALFFIITGLRRYRGRHLLTARPNLIREMVDMGHEVGSHTHTHKSLATLPAEKIRWECTKSVEALDSILNGRTDFYGLSYPYGAYNDEVVSLVGKSFRYGTTMGRNNRWNKVLDPYRIGTMGIRHLVNYPFKTLKNDVRLVVLTFHNEPSTVIKLLVEILKTTNFKMLPLTESLAKLGLISQ